MAEAALAAAAASSAGTAAAALSSLATIGLVSVYGYLKSGESKPSVRTPATAPTPAPGSSVATPTPTPAPVPAPAPAPAPAPVAPQPPAPEPVVAPVEVNIPEPKPADQPSRDDRRRQACMLVQRLIESGPPILDVAGDDGRITDAGYDRIRTDVAQWARTNAPEMDDTNPLVDYCIRTIVASTGRQFVNPDLQTRFGPEPAPAPAPADL